MRWSDTPRVEQGLLYVALVAFAVSQLGVPWDAYAPLTAAELGWPGLYTLILGSTSFGLWCCSAVLVWFQPAGAVVCGFPFAIVSLWGVISPGDKNAVALVCDAIVVAAWAGAALVVMQRRNKAHRTLSRAQSSGAPLRDDIAHQILAQCDVFIAGKKTVMALIVVVTLCAVGCGIYISHVLNQRDGARWDLATVTHAEPGAVTLLQPDGGTCTLSVLETYEVGDRVPALVSDTWCEITNHGEFVDPTWTVSLFVVALFLAAIGYREWYLTPRWIERTVRTGSVARCEGSVSGRRFPLLAVRWRRMPVLTITVPWKHVEVTQNRSLYETPGSLDGGYHAVFHAVALTKACGWFRGLRLFLQGLAVDADPLSSAPHSEPGSLLLMDPKSPRRGVLLYRTGEIFLVRLVMASTR